MMVPILWIMAAACVIYYAVIVVYSGFATSFSLIWLIFAVGLIGLALGINNYGKYKDRIPLWVPVSVITFCSASLLIFVVVMLLVFTGAAGREASGLDYVIVLGARVKEDGLSKSLQNRLDKAIEYLEDNPGTTLVLSGGQGKDEPVAEAEAMRDYLMFNGVPEKKMILETRSFSTVENVAYSRVAIEEDQEKRKAYHSGMEIQMMPGTVTEVPSKPLRIGVLTSDFHVFRAVQIGKKWGIPDIYGISCSSDPVLFVHFCVRECAAILKDKLVGNM